MLTNFTEEDTSISSGHLLYYCIIFYLYYLYSFMEHIVIDGIRWGLDSFVRILCMDSDLEMT